MFNVIVRLTKNGVLNSETIVPCGTETNATIQAMSAVSAMQKKLASTGHMPEMYFSALEKGVCLKSPNCIVTVYVKRGEP